MSSEEEDYMSDSFLQKCQNVRPGLIPKHVQRKIENEREDKNHQRTNMPIPKKKLEAHHRETGLNTEISSSSKGFRLLQKMGYKPGTGIGKSGEGRTEPIHIEVKSGREGLGRDMERKRRTNEINERRALTTAKKQKRSEQQTQSFLARMKDKFIEKGVEKDLRTAQTTCLQLDQKQDKFQPDHPFFWPARSLPTIADEDDLEEQEFAPKNISHASPPSPSSKNLFDDSDSDNDDSSSEPELPVTDKLEILTTYLRKTYKYCIWCGTAYDDDAELSSQCPGNSADSHN